MESVRGSICRSCRQRLSQQQNARSFSTSTKRQIVPPESPHFVDVPSSHQPYQPWMRPQKGTLPVPREIFPASQPNKGSPKYLKNATKEPVPKNVKPSSELTELGRHRQRMATLRKTQLREGLTALQMRKQTEINIMAARSQAKQRQRDQLLKQSEREDARLTNVSTPSLMKPDTPTTSIEALKAQLEIAQRMHERKSANVEKQQREKEAMKMDALHTLYIHSRHFITTPAQLDAKIHDQFEHFHDEKTGASSYAYFQSSADDGISLWNLGNPKGIKDMIGEMGDDEKSTSFSVNPSRISGKYDGKGAQGKFVKEQERMKRIAEKLSGGKI